MKTQTIRQTITFPTSPKKLYALLFDSKKLSQLHGAPTVMTRRASGKFTVFGGYCTGYNIALSEPEHIEQAWHFNEAGWPEDYHSTCIFNLMPAANGTKLVFIQKGVPESTYADIKAGWKTYYWDPIRKYLEGQLSKGKI